MYKNVQHYRYTVHRYLDSIWKVSSRQNKARSTMYSWLSTQMNLPTEDTHISKFTRNQCKQAIKILRPKYIALYGEDLPYKKKINEKESNKMAYKLKNNIIKEEYEYFGIEELVSIDIGKNKCVVTDNEDIIKRLFEAGLIRKER